MLTTKENESAFSLLSNSEFDLFRQLIYRRAGISLSPKKNTLVATRLLKRLRHYRLTSFSDYYELVTGGSQPSEMQMVIDLLTTNETYFFREHAHFEFLRDTILPQFERNRHLSIWSAACSSGEEPYTLAMLLADVLGLQGRWDITATDISSRVLAVAQRGVYPLEAAEKIPRKLLHAYCLKGTGGSDGTLLIDKRLRQKVQFRQFNLIESWSGVQTFSLIFLRNVMIYFDFDTKCKIVDRIYHHLEPGGYLFLGHSETLFKVSSRFKLVRPAVYQRID